MSSKTPIDKVTELAHKHFGIQGTISPLPGDEDENFTSGLLILHYTTSMWEKVYNRLVVKALTL